MLVINFSGEEKFCGGVFTFGNEDGVDKKDIFSLGWVLQIGKYTHRVPDEDLFRTQEYAIVEFCFTGGVGGMGFGTCVVEEVEGFYYLFGSGDGGVFACCIVDTGKPRAEKVLRDVGDGFSGFFGVLGVAEVYSIKAILQGFYPGGVASDDIVEACVEGGFGEKLGSGRGSINDHCGSPKRGITLGRAVEELFLATPDPYNLTLAEDIAQGFSLSETLFFGDFSTCGFGVCSS